MLGQKRPAPESLSLLHLLHLQMVFLVCTVAVLATFSRLLGRLLRVLLSFLETVYSGCFQKAWACATFNFSPYPSPTPASPALLRCPLRLVCPSPADCHHALCSSIYFAVKVTGAEHVSCSDSVYWNQDIAVKFLLLNDFWCYDSGKGSGLSTSRDH